MLVFLLSTAPIFASYLILCRALHALPRSIASRLLMSVLSLAVGLGVTSLTYFLWRWLVSPSPIQYLICEFGVSLAIIILWGRNRRKVATPPQNERVTHGPDKWLLSAFVVVGAVVLVNLTLASLLRPIGGWDAWANWNAKARFIAMSDDWQQIFTSGTFHHPDYPLLLPMANARMMSILAVDSSWIPCIVAALFTLGSVALLVTATAVIRGWTHAIVTGLISFAFVGFVNSGAIQCADHPFAFYVLATVVCVVLAHAYSSRPFLVLAGLLAGLGAWTKNEGVALLAALFVAHAMAFAYRPWKAAARDLVWLLTGVAPVAAILLAFKCLLAPETAMMAAQDVSTLGKLTDVARHTLIWQFMFSAIWRHAGVLIVIMPVILVWLGRRNPKSGVGCARRREVAVTLLLLVCAYYLVYLLTPFDLEWHLRTSIYRIAWHVWPVSLWLLMLGRADLDRLDRKEFTSCASSSKGYHHDLITT